LIEGKNNCFSFSIYFLLLTASLYQYQAQVHGRDLGFAGLLAQQMGTFGDNMLVRYSVAQLRAILVKAVRYLVK
jgi:hypothetical protein